MPKLGLTNFVATASCIAGLALSASVQAAPAETLQATMQTQTQIDQAAQRSQNTVNRIADQTQTLLGDYLLTSQQVDRLRVYNTQLEKLIFDQEEIMRRIEQELKDVEVVEKEILPLMIRMVDSLGAFVELDLPFNLEERRNRVAILRDMMDSSDVTVSEKYRRIMESYMIETDFGKSIEATRGTLDLGDGNPRQVDFLRVGRILLAYQSLDRSDTGFWDKASASWQSLDASYRRPITQGIRIARKQAAPDLLELPIPAPETAQ